MSAREQDASIRLARLTPDVVVGEISSIILSFGHVMRVILAVLDRASIAILVPSMSRVSGLAAWRGNGMTLCLPTSDTVGCLDDLHSALHHEFVCRVVRCVGVQCRTVP